MMNRYEKIVELNDDRLIERIVKTENEQEILALAKAGCNSKILVDYAYKNDNYDILEEVVKHGHVEERFLHMAFIFVKLLIPDQTDEFDHFFLTHHNPELRAALAKTGRCQEVLVYDSDPEVRKLVASTVKEKKIADILFTDENKDVKRELAKSGFFDNEFATDKDTFVRMNVAEYTKEEKLLKELAYDEDWLVRNEVAKRDILPNILMLDDVANVRESVARTTEDIEVLRFLKNDFKESVAYIAEERISVNEEYL